MFISDQIAINASYFSQENCTELASRYDSQVNFENDEWDDGFGFHSPCDASKPFARAINTVWLIENSTWTPNPPGDYSGDVIDWAYNYVVKKTPEFEANCQPQFGLYHGGTLCDLWVGCDRRIELSEGFHAQGVIERAELLLTFARLAGGWSYNGMSCDSCDKSFSYFGPNSFVVQWLAHFVRSAPYKTPYMVERALINANGTMKHRYDDCPGLRISSDGWFFSDASNCP